MNLFGLHLIDWGILLLYLALIIVIALRARRRILDTASFFQGNRSFGRILTAFLNFGNMTDASQVAGVNREIYRQGLSGIWFSNLVLFHTPFQWFIAAWQRRARYIGPGDMFLHRYESRFLAGFYAAILVVAASYGNTFGFLLTGKTIQAMMVVPESEYTPDERASVEGFLRLQDLRAHSYDDLDLAQRQEFNDLVERESRDELRAFVSYLDLTTFYIFYAIVIAAYTLLGGLFAIAVVDIIQGVLIIFLSLILIPLGLSAIGGIAGMQTRVPDAMTDLFGSSDGSEYTWYYVGAFALLNLVVNAPKSFTLGGSPKDDRTARIGFVTGALGKRFMMLGWAFTGLIAVGLYAGSVSDPTNIWGVMTRELLGVGAIGLMIAAIFSANMDGAATGSLDASAAFTKNILVQIRPGISERGQVLAGRIVIALILFGTVIFSITTFDDIVAVFKYALSIGAIVGPAFWMAYFWRRVNTKAVATQMLLSVVITLALPNIVPAIDSLAEAPTLTITDAPSASGDAPPGEPIYFERLETGEDGEVRGAGLFRANLWILDAAGLDITGWSAAERGTAAFLFDTVFPFILLILISLVTRPNSEPVLRDFYARINTPAVADPEEDARLVQQKIDDPELVEQNKMFPHTSIEFWKPTRFDIVGFLVCVLFVLGIIGLYLLLGNIVRG